MVLILWVTTNSYELMYAKLHFFFGCKYAKLLEGPFMEVSNSLNTCISWPNIWSHQFGTPCDRHLGTYIKNVTSKLSQNWAKRSVNTGHNYFQGKVTFYPGRILLLKHKSADQERAPKCPRPNCYLRGALRRIKRGIQRPWPWWPLIN